MYNKKYCNTECCNSIKREVEYILLTLNLQIWRVKNSQIVSQSYIIIAYIINFQVQSTPGQVQIKFHLYIFGIRLRLNWVVELKKVSRTTASLALRGTGPRAWD